MFRMSLAFVSALTCAVVFDAVGALASETQTIEGWGTLFDPEGDAKATEKNGAVELTVPGAYRDLWPAGRVNAPRILRPVQGDFSVQVKIASTVSTAGTSALADLPSGSVLYRSAALIIWQDENTFVRLERGSSTAKESRELWIYHTFDGGKRVVHQIGNVASAGAAYLWIARKQGTFYAYFRQEGDKKWTQLETHRLGLPYEVNVGVSLVNTTSEPFTVRFEDFQVATRVSLPPTWSRVRSPILASSGTMCPRWRPNERDCASRRVCWCSRLCRKARHSGTD